MPLRERTAIGLRDALRDSPMETIRDAVLDALGLWDGAPLVAHWLSDDRDEECCPPLTREQVEAIWNQALKRQQ